MPPRRRVNPPSAAALPASRLPLGTPLLTNFPKSPTGVRSSTPSPASLRPQSSNLSLDGFPLSGTDKENATQVHPHNMAPKPTADNVSAKSIAEAKLERQRKRIEDAEASLTAPPPLDRRAQTSRGKNAKWKPFDYTADASSANDREDDGGVQVTEVRVNTFRPYSRCSSVARSVSVLSHRTSDTGTSDVERQDSGLTESGFQTYTGRKHKKHVDDLNAYEDKPEQRQTTVEATFDKREIYDVFGNALPGPEFIEENVGFKNGQLQFLQHPNGDVSAQQWSADRYMWENIGQFSNIRKKVEGQLAADRLKGETAYQTLQQNTLAYFRIIAKQREATVMGLPFGPKDINAAIPEPASRLVASPARVKALANDDKLRQSTPSRSESSNVQQGYTSYHTSFRSADPTGLAQQLPYSQRQGYPNITPNIGLLSNWRDNQSHANHPQYYQPYGAQPYAFHGQVLQATPSTSYYPTSKRSQGLNYELNFPQPQTATCAPQQTSTQAGRADTSSLSGHVEKPWQQMYGNQIGGLADYGYPQYRTIVNIPAATATAINTANREPGKTSVFQSQHTVSSNPRTAARDQLWKLPETAKERSQSQANIRTVLFDPFQTDSPPPKTKYEEVPTKQETLSAFNRKTSISRFEPSSLPSSSSKFFPTGLIPQVRVPSSPTGSTITNNLHNSSPDNKPQYKQSHMNATPMITKPSIQQGTQQALQAPYFSSTSKVDSDTRTSSISIKQTYEENLQKWWTSGNKFARQEEFFQSLPSSTPPTQTKLAPIGPPSRTPKKHPAPPPASSTEKVDVTRLVIPVLENLAAYVQGPIEKRRDYFSQWCKPPDWCIDNSETGNNSFYDEDWGTPPARVGRDPRYAASRGWQDKQRETPRRGRGAAVGAVGTGVGAYGSPAGVVGGGIGIDRRFQFGGHF